MIFKGATDALFKMVESVRSRLEASQEEESDIPKNPFPILSPPQEGLLRNWLNEHFPDRCAPIEWPNEMKIASTARRQVVDVIFSAIDATKNKPQS